MTFRGRPFQLNLMSASKVDAYLSEAPFWGRLLALPPSVMGCIHNTSSSSQLRNWPNKLRVFVTGKPFQLIVMKQSSLLGRFVSYEEN